MWNCSDKIFKLFHIKSMSVKVFAESMMAQVRFQADADIKNIVGLTQSLYWQGVLA